jgi:uncharacterized protein (TIGR02302 family)
MSDSDLNRVTGRETAEAEARARIDRAVGRARLNLVWEAIWPLAAPILALGALFVALSWFGVWRLTSTPLRFVILAAFAAALLYFLVRLVRFAVPTRAAAFARVEQATGALHRPATSFSDRLATAPGDATADTLWMAHRRRLLAALERLRAGSPTPRLDRRDPFALRFLVAILFVAGFVIAGPEKIVRIGEAFQGGESTAATIARIDAWVTPPDYTGRPPIFLTGDAAKPAGTEYSVPAGSIVTVRTGGTHDLDVVTAGSTGDTVVAPEAVTKAGVTDAVPPLEHRVTLAAATDVVVRKSGREVSSWRFNVIPDAPPSIALVGEPQTALSGALHLSYSLKDDYGVVGAFGEIAPAADATSVAGARPLYEAPALPLSLPQLRIREGNGESTRDLTSHPWAGANVRMTLVAKDEAGQEGRSPPVELTLPTRLFANPLARAVVEQRAKLAMDANAADGVADALDALTMAPDKGLANVKNYLAVRSGYYRLINAYDDNDLRGVVDYLWAVALGIEDGGLSEIAEELRAAQEALRQALDRNASDDEIAKLTEQLRNAMQKFMQALAEQMQRNPQAQNQPMDPNAQVLNQQDLQKMIDRIEELAKTGARDAAKQLLSQLQNMMENLQAGQMQNGDQNNQQMMDSLNKLGDLIRKQEDLMNKTYQADRGQSQDGKPMTEQELQDALKQLQQGQQGLADALKELQKQLQGMGMQPGGKLGQAGEAMGRAEGELGDGSPGTAVGEQGNALEALRQGAQGLAQQFAQQQGQGGGAGMRGGGQFPNTDPLGRQQRSTGPDLGSTVKVPDEIDTQRAREILDAIRKRLGDTGRSLIERDYLERLLDRL